MPQDFSFQNLRGRSFRGQNLTGANFSQADIRGADFTQTILIGANFRQARAGLQKRSRIGLFLISLLLSVFSSFASVLAVTFAGYTLFPYSISPDKVLATLIVLALFLFFFRVALHEGLTSALVSVIICGVVLGAIIGLVAGGLAGIAAGVVSVTITTAIIAVMVVATTLILTMAHTVAGRVAGAAAMALILAGGMIGAIAGVTTGKEVVKVLNENGTIPALREAAAVDAIFAAWTGTLAGVLIATYICWRALNENNKLAWIKKISITFATKGSTSFHDADLTDADFSDAILQNTDLRANHTTRTLWYQCRKLDSARLENTPLAEPKIRNLLVSREGQGESYEKANLRGANLKDANLAKVNFRGADLSYATLEGACLEGANLTQVQAIGTNFTSSKLTGACLKDWSIDSATLLNEVECQYFYLFEKTQSEIDDRKRCPLNGEYKPGDFTQLVRKYLSSVEVIFCQGVEQQVEGKLVMLKLGKGDLRSGLPVTLQIGAERTRPAIECTGELPPTSEILGCYEQWQSTYRRSISVGYRLDVPETQVTNVSRQEFLAQCHESAENLKIKLNLWLNAEQFRPLKEELLTTLNTSDSIRFILQADNQLWRLPWHLWDFFERYPKAEIALSTSYKPVEKSIPAQAKVKILAILGNSTGIDIQKDRAMLEQLPDAAVTFLVEPLRQELNDQLWAQPWNILFFAGHSASSAEGETGKIFINPTECLTVPQLKYALQQAIAQGLQLAIFNSCDGLGLAANLANLHIPQMIVMREPVPDKVAQEFLKYFLAAFSSGLPLMTSVRQAREKLQGIEDEFPCATWLPVICQNPAEVPRTWEEFIRI